MISIDELNKILVAHNCLRGMSIQINDDELSYDLLLSLSVSENSTDEVVHIRFFDISHLSSSEVGGGLTQFMHMNVNKLDSGFERMRYQLIELEDNKLSFYFFSCAVE